ncbi:MAG TPA: gamma-glutamyltransferase [Solirubrobacteraceae bacterium]|nr:gamma-glutamyltransferase [Solirubrobacteraceae bacterium]
MSARAGADVLREGGNAVDGAVAAMLTSFVAEPLFTGLGAGGYMMVAGGSDPPVLLDFFVEAPGRETGRQPAVPMLGFDVDFGAAIQTFHAGPASCGVYGVPAGICAANARWGTWSLADLAAPAAEIARRGVRLNREQAYVVELLEGLLTSSPAGEVMFRPGGHRLREGDVMRNPDLADTLERLGMEGDAPFYRGDIADAVCDWIAAGGGSLGCADLRAYEAILREPVSVGYRGRRILSNPPPSAGGTLLAYSLSLLERADPPPALEQVVGAMAMAQAERTPEFVDGLAHAGFLERFLEGRMGSTTHIAVLDSAGFACSVTTSIGEGSAVVVPGTGIHLNNMMGEEDLNPLGFHRHEPGRRLPSMMAPTIVMSPDAGDAGQVELVLGSAGSNRIRSALLQTIIGVVDHGLTAAQAIRAPRVHFEDGRVYAEPGIDTGPLQRAGYTVTQFAAANLFFGGVQAVQQRDGLISGGGDPRRGGVAVSA